MIAYKLSIQGASPHATSKGAPESISGCGRIVL